MKIHFTGIGGISMSGLARYFKAKGFKVSGSDLRASGITSALRREGIRVAIGPHIGRNVPKDTDLVVYNRAITKDNPELAAARVRHIPLLPLAEAIGKLTEIHKTIAITGSHGKSTTTALATLLCLKAGFDPTVFIGTNLKELGDKNLRIGKSPWLVLEADDFGKAFLAYSPAIAIVTNIDREHLDFYKSFAALKNSFLAFLMRTHEHGVLILNQDDRVLSSLRTHIAATAKKRHLTVMWYSLREPAAKTIKRHLQIPGTHNLSNALATYHLGKVLEVPERKILSALGSYRGAWRRMEYRGMIRARGIAISVFDDYAHHPTEIRATLQAFREKFPKARLVCVFEPHQTARLRLLFKEFKVAFGEADALIMLPSYHVAGRDLKDPRFTSEKLSEAIKKSGHPKTTSYLAHVKNLKKAVLIEASARKNVVIMMGAGDIVNYTGLLLSK